MRDGLLVEAVTEIAARMAINKLRLLLSEDHICGFREHPELLDIGAVDPFAEERLHRIVTQLTAALVLKSILSQRCIDTGNSMDLTVLVRRAQKNAIINAREAGILKRLNQLANEAKHDLVFHSRL